MSDRGRQPAWLRDLGSILRGVAGHDVARIDENGGACTALLELHALADEACGGVGIPISPADKKASTRAENARDPRAADAIEFLMRANLRLAQRGTLAEVDASVVRVLPKLRTPQTGITLRSLSQHLSAHVTEVEVKWEFHETLCADTAERINLLVLPVA